MHCAFFLSVQNTKFRQRFCTLVHPSWDKRPHVKLCCNLSATPMCNLFCASLDTKMRRPNRVLLANVDPCHAEKLRRTCLVSILFALVLGQLPAKQVMQSRANYQLSFVTPWCKLWWQGHMPCFLTTFPPFQPAHENITFGMI